MAGQEYVTALEMALSRAIDALIWCGGSPDFAPEGAAALGWAGVVVPVIAKSRLLLGERYVADATLDEREGSDG